jgi:HK97 family phage portal protein
MARRKTSTTQEASTTQPAIAGEVIEKAHIAIPSPDRVRISILGQVKSSGEGLAQRAGRRTRASIYYEMYRQHGTVRAAIEKIAKVAVSNGYTLIPEEPGADVPKEPAKAIRKFLRQSNSTQLFRLTYKDLLIYGECFWWIEKTRGTKPYRAKRLHPRYIDIETDGIEITKFIYSPDGPDAENTREYSPDEIVHFKIDDPGDDLYGLSLLDSLQTTVAVDLFAAQFNGKFFENAAQTGTVFALKSQDPAEIERNREYLNQNYVGTENAHKPLLLEGDVDVKKSVSTPQEMQFIEGRKFNREEILSVLDLPPDKLGIYEDVNRSTSSESDNSFRQETIQPLQSIVEEEFNNRVVLEMFGYDNILFAHSEVSRRDSLDQMKLLSEAERMGVMSPNEIRAQQFGLPPVEGGDEHFIQTAAGLIPLELLEEAAKALFMPVPASGVGTENPAGGGEKPAKPESKFDPAAPSIGDLRG